MIRSQRSTQCWACVRAGRRPYFVHRFNPKAGTNIPRAPAACAKPAIRGTVGARSASLSLFLPLLLLLGSSGTPLPRAAMLTLSSASHHEGKARLHIAHAYAHGHAYSACTEGRKNKGTRPRAYPSLVVSRDFDGGGGWPWRGWKRTRPRVVCRELRPGGFFRIRCACRERAPRRTSSPVRTAQCALRVHA